VKFTLQCAPAYFAALLWLSPTTIGASDWPQFLGPNRNGSITNAITNAFPKDGPKRLWRRKVGQGFSGPVIVEGKVLLFHRQGNEEVLEAFDAQSGETRWQQAAPTGYVDDFGFDEGPRGTPCVRDGRVFTFGAEARLSAVSLADGKKLWEVDTKARFQSDKGFFGAACSPLVEGNLVLLNLGGGAGVAAFATDTGKLVWKVTDDEAGYSSPVMMARGQERLAVFFTRSGLEVVDPVTGKLRCGFPWRARMNASVNAASPVVEGDEILLTASYGAGATLLCFRGDRAESVWSGDDSISAHYATPVKHGEFLYGFHGRQESGQSFRCVEWRTGKVRWNADGLPAGTVAVSDNQLVLLLESGELTIAPASPDAFQPRARAQVLGAGTRAPFALADGIFAGRDKNQLVAVTIGP
jgi:outer membrane protein assembly factor BamB